MNATVRAALGALAVCGAALLAGCGLGLESPLRLVTNRAEMAAYVDRFNALQSEVKVEISYQESPAQAVTDGVSGDVVIGEWLATQAVMDRLEGFWAAALVGCVIGLLRGGFDGAARGLLVW